MDLKIQSKTYTNVHKFNLFVFGKITNVSNVKHAFSLKDVQYNNMLDRGFKNISVVACLLKLVT